MLVTQLRISLKVGIELLNVIRQILRMMNFLKLVSQRTASRAGVGQRLADRVGPKIDGFCSELCWRNAGHAPC